MPTHTEIRKLSYSAQQMYQLVADVTQYPEFLPWCSGARILREARDGESEVMDAELVISFKAFREKWISRVRLWPGTRKVHTEYIDGPFRHMHSTWAFHELENGCKVEFFVDFELRNFILRKLLGLFFEEAMRRIVRAFIKRAEELHG